MSDKKNTAILFVHGILGTPNHFDPYIPFVPEDWTVCRITLKGHCGSVKDFSKASMAEWKQQVNDALKKLQKEHERVVIVAHSMGTLFSIQEALEKEIAGLFLLNVPLKVGITTRLFKMMWNIFWGSSDPDDAWMAAAEKAYSIERDRHILRYIGWLPRYFELFSEIRKTRNLVSELTVPTYAYLSIKDEMVSPKSRRFIQNHPAVTLKMLNESGHFYYAPKDQTLLIEDFKEMVQGFSEE